MLLSIEPKEEPYPFVLFISNYAWLLYGDTDDCDDSGDVDNDN